MALDSSNDRLEQLLSASRAMYIIDSTGILLHHEFFLGQSDDPDLYSGLFAAVNVYASELKAGAIKTINLKNNKFVFQEDDETGHLIVLDINSEVGDTEGSWLLSQITKRFDAMMKLMREDFKGSLTLETLFDDRGKEINWNMIQAIREDAIDSQKQQFDQVETLNLTRINLKNRTWVKIRKMVQSLFENQKGIIGGYLFISKNDHINKMYSGKDRKRLESLYGHIEEKVKKGIGLELETEFVEIEDLHCAIFPMLLEDGGTLAIAADDKYIVDRLTNQMERLVAAVEKIGISG